MRAKLTLLLYLLLIPAAAFWTAKAIEQEMDAHWESALQKELPTPGRKLSAVLPIAKACDDADMRGSIEALCSLHERVVLIDRGALGTGIAGLVLLGVIGLAGRLARGRRRLLLALFSPGLHLTMLSLAVLMLLHAALGIGAIYYGESVFWDHLHVRFMVMLGVGAVIGIVSMLSAQWSAIQRVTTTALGKRLPSTDQPILWQFVKALAKEVGTAPPDSIVVGLDPNFYVTEAEVICLDGALKGRTMYLSLPLCRILSLEELKAVLGHELGHYRGLDTRFSQKFYPIYRGTREALVALSNAPRGAATLAVLPAIHMLSFFLDAFSGAEREISRERELAADAAGAALNSSPAPMASALVKVHAFSVGWTNVRNGMVEALGKGQQLVNASTLFQALVGEMAKGDPLSGLGEEGPPHPTDTHPPLSQRMQALHITVAAVAPQALDISPEPPAVSIMQDVEVLEQELTDVEHVMLVKWGGAQVGKPAEESPEPVAAPAKQRAAG